MSIQKAIVYNIVSSVLSFIGMAAGVWIGEYEAASLWIYAFTAGAFLYISLVDLVSKHTVVLKSSFKKILLKHSFDQNYNKYSIISLGMIQTKYRK
jgi:zinc transporter ZupT